MIRKGAPESLSTNHDDELAHALLDCLELGMRAEMDGLNDDGLAVAGRLISLGFVAEVFNDLEITKEGRKYQIARGLQENRL